MARIQVPSPPAPVPLAATYLQEGALSDPVEVLEPLRKQKRRSNRAHNRLRAVSGAPGRSAQHCCISRTLRYWWACSRQKPSGSLMLLA